MADFATVDDVIALWRVLAPEETERTAALLPVVSDSLRIEAEKVGKDLDAMAQNSTAYANVLKSVTVDVIARTLMTSTSGEPMAQESQSALGYSWSGTYLVPGGGLFIKIQNLLGSGFETAIRVINFYAEPQRNHGYSDQ